MMAMVWNWRTKMFKTADSETAQEALCMAMKYVPAIALVCAATTSIVDPASRCSSVSPTQAITFKPWESAYATLSPTN